MSMTPETFESELRTRLGRDYRLRRSPLTNRWLIEQHVGRGIWEEPLNDWDDSAIRARDGYALVCSVYPVPYMLCPICKSQLDLPHLSIGEVHCRRCEIATGETISYFGGYFPLCDALIARLERTSPKRSKAFKAELDDTNRRRREAAEKATEADVEDIFADHYNRFMDRPQIGYGGSIKSTGDWTTT